MQDVFGGLGQYRPNDAQTAPLAQPSHSHQAHQSGGRGLHLPTALPCFLGGYNEGKVRKTRSELPRVDFPYLIERSGGRGILPLVSRVPEPVLPKLTDSLRAVFCQAPAHPLRGLTSIPRKSSKRPAFFAGGLKARSWGGTGTGSLLPSRSYLKFTEWHHFLTFLHCTPSTCHGTQLAQDALPALALQAAGIVMGTKADRIGHRSTDTGPIARRK